MALLSNLLKRLQSVDAPLNLLHLTIHNWIVFQRDSFDIFDEHGDPFTTQIFLIEVSTGKYIHRAQGHKVDFGATLDLDILYSKLTEAFINSRVCQGFPLETCSETKTDLCIQEFPYKRKVAQNCQYLYKPLNPTDTKSEPGARWVCPPCQKLKSKAEQNTKTSDPDLCLENPVKLEAVLDEDIELFPPTLEKPEEYKEEDSESSDFDFGLSSESDDNKDSSRLKISPLRQNCKKKITKRKVNNSSVGEKPKKAIDKEEEVLDKPAKRIFSCNHCTETFFTQGAYQRHQRNKRRVGCKECEKDKYVITFKQLIEHTFKNHRSIAKKYRKYEQNAEELKSIKVPMKCSLCDMIFNGTLLLYRHKEIYHELGDYRCSTCQEACLTYYDLAIHNYQKHDQALEHIQPQTYGLEAVSFPDGKIEYKRECFACQHCGASYTTDSSWAMHMRAKHSWDLFECKSCDETCHYASDFSAHMLAFHPENPEIKCPTPGCSNVSNLIQNPDHFNEHFKGCQKPANNYKHFPEKNLFQCETCGKNYVCKAAFQGHIKRHQGIERFKCTHCDFGTNTKAILIDHEKAHLREKGLTNADTDLVLYHQCDQCGKQFALKRTLREHHKRAHLGIKIGKECTDCGQMFYSQSAMYNHKRKLHGFVSKHPWNSRGRRKGRKEAFGN